MYYLNRDLPFSQWFQTFMTGQKCSNNSPLHYTIYKMLVCNNLIYFFLLDRHKQLCMYVEKLTYSCSNSDITFLLCLHDYYYNYLTKKKTWCTVRITLPDDLSLTLSNKQNPTYNNFIYYFSVKADSKKITFIIIIMIIIVNMVKVREAGCYSQTLKTNSMSKTVKFFAFKTKIVVYSIRETEGILQFLARKQCVKWNVWARFNRISGCTG